MKRCNHTIGIYYDYDATDLVHQTDEAGTATTDIRPDDRFRFCPACGRSLQRLWARTNRALAKRQTTDGVKIRALARSAVTRIRNWKANGNDLTAMDPHPLSYYDVIPAFNAAGVEHNSQTYHAYVEAVKAGLKNS